MGRKGLAKSRSSKISPGTSSENCSQQDIQVQRRDRRFAAADGVCHLYYREVILLSVTDPYPSAAQGQNAKNKCSALIAYIAYLLVV